MYSNPEFKDRKRRSAVMVTPLARKQKKRRKVKVNHSLRCDCWTYIHRDENCVQAEIGEI